ncbi:YaeQ family protein [Pandoraea communis]|uniref:Cellulose synthase operon C protein n=1 Tax=Pandoraea communis TaxID=2508297 RepID=A0A5E4S001_9BURK|nr:YaeQ family protein [Pandoraea communis]MDM8355319.1 YaeQ family protein [Pandoraea communis]VVD67388.1 cellulose synthase operon C protein [Pandoraea communis]
MALKATIYKAEVQITDLDRHYYASHSLTLARHPSETDERMMVRLLAFMLYASERLSFGKGISTADEPDLWEHDFGGDIVRWIDVGQPDARRLVKAAGRAEHVDVLAYGGKPAAIWWQATESQITRLSNLTVRMLDEASAEALTALASRTMRLQCTIQDGDVWVADDHHNLPINLVTLRAAATD